MSSGAAVGAIISAASSAAQTAAAAAQSSKQRSFVAEQRRTAFQTQREDLEAAGYNPLYALTGGGQGAPSVNYQPPDTTAVGNIGSGFGDYLDNKLKIAKEKESRNVAMNQNAQANNNAAQGSLASSAAELNSVKTKIEKEVLKGAKVEGAMDASAFGKATRATKRLIDSVNPLTQGVGGALIRGRKKR